MFEMINYLELLVIFVSSFFFKSFFRLFFKHATPHDSYFHLYFIEFIRNNGIRNLIEKKKFIKPFGLDYPWLLHLFLSFFPRKYDKFLEKFTNPFLDSLFVIFLYLVTLHLTASSSQALMLITLYVLTPAMFTNLIDGPRLNSFNPRLFGEILGGVIFVLEYLYFLEKSYIFLVFAVVIAALSFLSSKFTAQAIVFINILLFLFTFEYEYLAVLFGGLILSIILSGGGYLKIFKLQVEHLRHVFLIMLKDLTPVSERNSFKILIKNFKFKNYKYILKFLFYKNTLIIILTRFPLACLSLYLIYESYKISDSLVMIDYFILSSFIIFFISSLKWFLFIGEAERYLNHVIFFILLKVVLFFELDSLYLIFFLLYGFLFYISEFIFTLTNKTPNKTSDHDELIRWLNNQKKELKIATIPYHVGGYGIIYQTKHSWLFNCYWNNKEKDILNSYVLKIPFLDITRADEIIRKYDLDYIFYDKNLLNQYFKGTKIPSHLKQKKISDNIFAIYC